MNLQLESQNEIHAGQRDWARTVAMFAYIWGLPIVACWKDRLAKMQIRHADGSIELAVNRFRHCRSIASGDDDEYVNAGSDFLYSTAIVDLSSGPVAIESGDFEGRWFGVQLLDPYMETIENFGTRRTGSQIKKTLIVGPNHCVGGPEDQERFGDDFLMSENNYLYLVARIAVAPVEDLGDLHRLQDQLVLSRVDKRYLPDDAYRQQSTVEPGKGHPALFAHRTRSACSVDLKYFQELAATLCHVPPRQHEGMLTALLAEIGIVIGQEFDEKSLPNAIVEGLREGVQAGQSILARKYFEVGEQINGWGFVRNVGRYRDDYVVRALVAKHGIWANVPEETLYFIARTDSEGQPLVGNRRYQIHFEKDAVPAVKAFWSISAYDDAGRIPGGSCTRHTLNSKSDLLVHDDDGGVTIELGAEPPRRNGKLNWIRTAESVFSLNLRCYQPSDELLSGDVFVPPIVPVEGIHQ